MRFMVMHKHDPRTERGEPPPPGLVEKMGAFIGGHAKAGRLKDGAGLGASKTRSRLTFSDGNAVIEHGPYRGVRELPTELHLLEVKTREDGLAWAEKYGQLLGDGEIELGKVNEPWDIGVMPEPPNPPLHLLLIEKELDPKATRTPEKQAALEALKKEMRDAGVLMRSIKLAPSTTAKRLNFVDNDLKVVDGPFAESKELIGGFAVLDFDTWEEAIAMSREYAAILGGTLEADMRIVDHLG